jgi:uncharacterized protein with HEPN domain
MSSNRTAAVLNDILRHIELADEFLGEATYLEFEKDVVRIYAITRCLEIISEASRRLPDALKARHPGIQWREMAGAGNIYRHNYEDVAPRFVWQTVKTALPQLRKVIEIELAEAR